MNYNHDEKHYIWNLKWENKYESIWGLLEKFRYVNVLAVSYNNLLSFRKSASVYIFDTKLLCNKRGRLDLDSKIYRWRNTIPILYKIDNVEELFHKTLYYCPICMKTGYHSVLHQLKFVDYCFIHNSKLIERCQCNTGYAIEYKNELFNAFQCKKCNASIDDIPLAIDGILKDWKVSIKDNIVNESDNNIRAIYYIDPNLKLSNSTGILTDNQKNVLKNLIFTNSAEECTPKLVINSYDSEYPLKCYHKIMEFNFHERYGFEYCKNQYQYIIRWNFVHNIKMINFNVIAYFYTMYELLLKRYVDKIFPINYGITALDYDAEGNDLLQIAYSWRGWKEGFSHWKENVKSHDNVVSNYIYENIVNERYNDILNYIIVCLYSNSKDNVNYIYAIEHVNKCSLRLKANSNFDLCIDNMLMGIWEEMNENSYRS